MKIRVLDIIAGTIVDGPGLRTSIYVAGCRHGCEGCHNPQSWDFSSGHDMSVDEIIEHVEDNGFNVTLSGGDPLYQIDAVIELCDAIRSIGKNIWCYTGFTYEEIISDNSLARILDHVDVIVEGRFISSLKDPTLQFRGSSNQRIIHVNDIKNR